MKLLVILVRHRKWSSMLLLLVILYTNRDSNICCMFLSALLRIATEFVYATLVGS
jgi:hypothetical protein